LLLVGVVVIVVAVGVGVSVMDGIVDIVVVAVGVVAYGVCVDVFGVGGDGVGCHWLYYWYCCRCC